MIAKGSVKDTRGTFYLIDQKQTTPSLKKRKTK